MRQIHPFGEPSKIIMMSVVVSIVPMGAAWRFVHPSSLVVAVLFAAGGGMLYCVKLWMRRRALTEGLKSLFEAVRLDRERPLATNRWEVQE